jgi:hypothetical protein
MGTPAPEFEGAGIVEVSGVPNDESFWDELEAFTPDGLSAVNPYGSTKFSGSFLT